MKKLLCILLSLVQLSILTAQESSITPQPYSKKVLTGQPFVFSAATRLIYNNDAAQKTAALFNFYLEKTYGFTLPATPLKKKDTDPGSLPGNAVIFYAVPDATKSQEEEESYEMAVSQKNILIKAAAPGLVHGTMSLLQLLPVEKKFTAVRIPALKIEDKPRFAYRGMHLDAGRHFFPVSFIKKYIDYLAFFKFNYFHWHLTEDQGWRLEIKKYPNLTKTGAWRNGTIIGRYPGKGNDNTPHGGFYTQEEVKEVVQYAADRFITIVPEIELPGHSSAAIASYSWLSCFQDEPTRIPAHMISEKSKQELKNGRIKLVQETWGVFDDVFCAGKDSTFAFLEDVLDEVMNLFPSKYIHVGGDECPKSNWKRCPRCQARMKAEHLKDEHELQSYFIQRIEKYLNQKGRVLIGWDEILEGGLAPNAVVMSWRGEAGGIEAAKQHHDVIMTPGNPVYFDHSQSENEDSVTIGGYNPVEKVYAYEPVPGELTAEQAKYILGAQANVWTEYMDNEKKVEYMIFPRISALSEVLWGPKQNRNWDDFEKRIPGLFSRYELWGAGYSKAYFDMKATVAPTTDYTGVLWKVESKNKNSYIALPASATSSATVKYEKPLLIKKSGTKLAMQFINNKQVSAVSQPFHFNKATGKKITLLTPASRNYPGDGAFTLVNGVQNEKGMARSKEFLGFSGTDCEAVIDLGKPEMIKEIIAHTLEQKGSWIYAPSGMQVWLSDDAENFRELPLNSSNLLFTRSDPNGMIKALVPEKKARYVKIRLANAGTIPEGNPGAGNKAWLFTDEIEIN